MTSSSDRFRYDDGAYVMGALDDADRRAFEAHLETCPDCHERVAEARAAVDLLSGVTATEVAEPPPMPDTLLPGLLGAVQRERARGRWLITSLGAVAAACVTAVVVLLWPASSSQSGPAPRALTAVRTSPITATAKLISREWGTEIDVVCHYRKNVEHYAYRLIVVDDQGNQHSAGGWKLAPGEETAFTGGTSVRLSDIARVEIARRGTGKPILRLNA
jgi:anti-sigma-K factor RskA